MKNCCKNCIGCNQLELNYFREKENCINFVYGGKEYDLGIRNKRKSYWKGTTKV